MLLRTRLKRLLDLVPGKRQLGVYRFLPCFFVLGGVLEWIMINVRIGHETFSEDLPGSSSFLLQICFI
ncbi:small integral membrane protein 4 isoform X2 [Chiloscyllium plagiosum]|uniref:small integral membrane protein 4 isoform X2 n=1 Tax=Chiloscyllium plagiosum TaxID=36176 RepID=UPI001CB7B6F1|nr:small integral membrane protein 4 isoform X2 [Chiloscyllium plagiosum]